MEHEATCPIWGTVSLQQSFESAAGRLGSGMVSGYNVDSNRSGGTYSIDQEARNEISRLGFDDEAKARLTTWLVDERRHGVERPRITKEIVQIVGRRRSLPVHERANRLLTFIQSQTTSIGKRFCFSLRYLEMKKQSWLETETFAQMKAWSESKVSEPVDVRHAADDEVVYLIDYLTQKGLLEEKVAACGVNSQGHYNGTENYFEYVITPDGHAHLAEIGKRDIASTQAFVAMWFDELMRSAYDEGIEKAIRDAGYEPLRIDRKDHNNKIDDEIIAEIRRSRFLVADFTQGRKGTRGGVYYEAGFAHGLDMPVIFTCRADAIKKVHFDTRQYNHIKWETPEELRTLLAQRISATIGDGPLRD